MHAQVELGSLENRFTDLKAIPEEVIYIHLNKSIFLKGEDIGVTSYVYDKKKTQPSLVTRNVYTQLLPREKNTVKEDLLLVENGSTSYNIETDSTLANGELQFENVY